MNERQIKNGLFDYLIDREILGFIDWKDEAKKTDIKHFGHPIERNLREWDTLYRMYLDFQTKESVIERRKYLFRT